MEAYYQNDDTTIYKGNALDVLKTLPDQLIDCVCTSPPYFCQRDYGDDVVTIWDADPSCEHEWQDNSYKRRSSDGHDDLNRYNDKTFETLRRDKPVTSDFCQKCGAWRGALGLEPDVTLYLAHLLSIFREVKRVLKDDGTCWVNMGSSYKDKCDMLIPERFAIGMVNDGWLLRSKIVWKKVNCLPQSARDRFTMDWEYVYLFVKNGKYYFKQQFEPLAKATQERLKHEWKSGGGVPKGREGFTRFIGGEVFNQAIENMRERGMRTKRAVWSIPTEANPSAHFASYPERLVHICLDAGCPTEVCNKCGEARYPIMHSEYQKKDIEWHPEKYGDGDEKGARRGRMQPTGTVKNTSKHIGWTDCGCNAGFSPGIVLDPFAGSGTTGVVAIKQKKKAIMIEMSESYISDIMIPRLKETQPVLFG